MIIGLLSKRDTLFCTLWPAHESATFKNLINLLKNSHSGVPFCLASEGAVLETQFHFLKTHISGMPVCFSKTTYGPKKNMILVRHSGWTVRVLL